MGALMRAPLAGTGQVGIAFRTVLGVAVGTAVTPALIGRLPEMACSVALIPLFVMVIGLIGYPFFRRVCGFDHATAYYSAMPGGLQDMLIFGEEAGGDVRALSLIHATRVLVIVSIAPFLLTTVWGVPLTNPVGQPAADLPVIELVYMLLAAFVGWKLGERIGLFGASILGPLIVSAALSLGGIVSHRPPAEAILAAQFFIGIGIGEKYTGVTWGELRRDVLAGGAFCVILAILALIFAEGVSLSGLAPPIEAFLAFAPGGQAEMAVLSIVAGADLAFVVTHHLVRIIVVIAGAPVVARFAKRYE
jgi:membrane AbrB-like protein